jgi:hypothetical protein
MAMRAASSPAEEYDLPNWAFQAAHSFAGAAQATATTAAAIRHLNMVAIVEIKLIYEPNY